jgi:hypothetical protein
MSEKQLDLFESIEKASQKTDNTELSGVITLSKKLVEQSKIVEDLTSALKEETKKLNKIQFEDLPELMNEIDMVSTEIEVDGKVFKLSKSEKFYASVTRERKPFVIKWLRDNNHTGLIKNEIIAQVGKGKDNVAADVCAYIENAGLDVTREENIHTGSFKALVKDDIEKGKDVPLDELGVSRVIQASLKEVT